MDSIVSVLSMFSYCMDHVVFNLVINFVISYLVTKITILFSLKLCIES
ncbi:hypothetical protein HanIR_Chr11g0525751 [Helianthus annuus]|nr:hypothetical protein HanIR_Chr11g0525751 [Helianthus annuus]